MCLEIYVGTKTKSELKETTSKSGFWAKPLPLGEHHARKALKSESVYEVGSFLGCTCGLAFGPWSAADKSENHEQRKDNAAAFRRFLLSNKSDISGIVTISEFHGRSHEKFPQKSLDPDTFLGEELQFEDDVIYELICDKQDQFE